MVPRPLRVCILTSQYFNPNKIGGFGSMSRALAEALAARHVPTSVIVPRRADEPFRENLKGVEIFRFPSHSARKALSLLKSSPATVFHSQDPTILTPLAVWARPDAAHVVTCRDPRDWRDWLIEFRYATWDRRLRMPRNWFFETGPLVRWGVRRADAVYVPAGFLVEKVRRIFSPRHIEGVMPNLIAPPARRPHKNPKPVITFVGRLDPRKQPELFLDLASRFPRVQFQVVGQAESRRRDAELRRRYADRPNVRWIGLVDRFREPERMARILARSWILVNTSKREGLPLTFLEAAAWECAVVSALNPEDFVRRFGQHARDGDFEGAIRRLLSDPRFLRSEGRAARKYVLSIHGKERAIRLHLKAYRRALQRRLEGTRR